MTARGKLSSLGWLVLALGALALILPGQQHSTSSTQAAAKPVAVAVIAPAAAAAPVETPDRLRALVWHAGDAGPHLASVAPAPARPAVVLASATVATPPAAPPPVQATALTAVNVHAEGTTGSEVIFSLQTDQTASVLETSGNWTKISANGQTGWVYSKFLTTAPAANQIAAAQ